MARNVKSRRDVSAPAADVPCLVVSEPEENTSLVHQKFGNYELIWTLSHDALSTTYAAQREGCEGLLALRVFNSRARSDAQVRQIQKAAKSAAEFTHINAATVYENGLSEDGSPYVVTEWVEGETLDSVLVANKRLDINRSLSIFMQVCEALIEAHSHQLVHGNLTPHKVLLTDQESQDDLVKVVGFGMPPDTVQGAFYLSLEQNLDQVRVDARTDIYSLGCIMYETLSGTPPFVGHKAGSLNLLHELAHQYSPKSPEHKALKLLDCIIIKCMQPQRSKRFRDVRELLDALRLVSECMNGATKKLPASAERLFLFRFLEASETKMFAAAFATIFVCLAATKVVAEVQLQKYIDRAQFAAFDGKIDDQIRYWGLALRQAQSAKKPPGLVAEIHWNLGAAAFNQANSSGELDKHAQITMRASIREYEKALSYYEHRPDFKSNALMLSTEIADHWLLIDNDEQKQTRRAQAVAFAEQLSRSGEFAKALDFCSSRLGQYYDSRLSQIAMEACTKLAIGESKDLDKAIMYAARAWHYRYESSLPVDLPVRDEFLRLLPLKRMSLPEDTVKLAAQALKRGDIEAADGIFKATRQWPGLLGGHIVGYLSERRNAAYVIPSNTPSTQAAIAAYKKAIKLRNQLGGGDPADFYYQVLGLARCYVAVGNDKAAVETYAAIERFAGRMSPSDKITYASVLWKSGLRNRAISYLEKSLVRDNYSPCRMQLLEMYVAEKRTDKVEQIISDLVPKQPGSQLASYSRYGSPLQVRFTPMGWTNTNQRTRESDTSEDPFAVR